MKRNICKVYHKDTSANTNNMKEITISFSMKDIIKMFFTALREKSISATYYYMENNTLSTYTDSRVNSSIKKYYSHAK